MITTIVEKLIRGERLSVEEEKKLLEWFARQEQKPTQDIVAQTVVDTLLSRLDVTDLSKIANQIGLQIAGEFRTGNGQTPGDGFTGGRFGYPGFEYDGVTYFLVGVEDDALQVGLSLANGKVYAGGGSVRLDNSGIAILDGGAGQAFLSFYDQAGTTELFAFKVSSGDFQLQSLVAGEPMSFLTKLTDASTPYIKWYEHPSLANLAYLQINAGSTPTQVEIGNDIILCANRDGTATVFNELSNDIDFRIEGSNNPKAFVLDGGLDSITSLAFNGWHSREFETWTRTGNHTFTVSGDLTAVYRKGTKIRYDDGATEYGVIGSSTHAAGTTTVNLIPNTDYTMAAATITDTYLSYIENPEGFPQWFAFDANPQGFSVVPANPNYRWTTKGNTIYIAYIEGTNGTSNATTFAATAPIAPVYNVTGVAGTLVDNGALLTVAGRVVMTAGSTAITFRTDMGNGAWTAANGKRAAAYWFYEY